MTIAPQGLGQKIAEWAVIAALMAVIGYLVGNSDAMTMKAAIERHAETNVRHERQIEALRLKLDALVPRVERLDTLSEIDRERRKGQV